MTERKVKSGPEIVKEFIESLGKDESLDKGTIEIIQKLYSTNKFTQRLSSSRPLEANRKEPHEHG